MRQHIKKILILIPAVLLLNGCGVGGFLALSKLFTTIGKLWFSFTKIILGGKLAQQNPEATGQIIFMILLIGGIAVLLYYFSKKQKSKSITKTTATTTIEAKQENIPKEKLSSDETPKVEEKITQPQQETAGLKIGYWLAKNLENFKDPKTLKDKTPNEKMNQEKITEIKKDKPKEKLSWDTPPKVKENKSQQKQQNTEVKNWFFENFKDPTTLKVNASNEKKQQETKKEIKKDEPKKILTWDEPAKPEPKKEELKLTEVTITPQEEEEIYEQVAKELKENRSEGVWLKAFTENDGDETKTKIAYTKKRVNLLIEELKIKKGG